MRSLLYLMAAVAGAALPGPAGAVDLQFRFENVNGSFAGGVVTGRLLGLVDNATSAPTAVLVDTFPAGLTALAAPIAMAGVSTATAYTNPASHAAITLAGGLFAGGEAFYELVYDTNASPKQLVLSINGQAKFNYLYFYEGATNTFLNVSNEQGPAGISLTPVPEPAAALLLGAGLVALGWRQGQRVARTAAA